MAEASIATNVYQVRIHGRIEGQEYINVMHFQAVAGGDDIVEFLIVIIYLCFLNSLVPALGGGFTLEKVSTKRVAPDVGPEWDYSGEVDDVLTGAAEGDTLPSFVALRCNIRCARGGRSGKGSFAIAGIPDAATTGSSIVPGSSFETAWKAFVECIRTSFLQGHGFSTKKFHIGVVSRTLGAAKPPYAIAQFSTAVSLTPMLRCGSQVSRKIGHGS
jgi:hypothetical protein